MAAAQEAQSEGGVSEQAFRDMFGAAVGQMVKGGKELNAMYKEVTPSAREREERQRRRAIKRNGGEVPARSRAELLATRKWQIGHEALVSAGLQWFEGGGKPQPKKVDPDPTRTHLLPKKMRRPAATRSELVARRRKADNVLAASMAPTKEHSIHPANLPKMQKLLGSTVGWWQEDKHNLMRGIDRGAGTRHWGRDDGEDKLNQTIIDGGFNHSDTRNNSRQQRRRDNEGWVEFPVSQVVSMPLLDDQGRAVRRQRGGTPRLPTPKRHRRRIKVQDGLVREQPDLFDPLRTREIKKEELQRKRQLAKGVTQKVSKIRPPSSRAPNALRVTSHLFTDSVLAFGPMVRSEERFPKDPHLDEFGKSSVVLAEELAPVPSCFSGMTESYRLTRSFGPGPNIKDDKATFEDEWEEPGIVYGSSIQLPPRTAPSGSARSTPRIVEFADNPSSSRLQFQLGHASSSSSVSSPLALPNMGAAAPSQAAGPETVTARRRIRKRGLARARTAQPGSLRQLAGIGFSAGDRGGRTLGGSRSVAALSSGLPQERRNARPMTPQMRQSQQQQQQQQQPEASDTRRRHCFAVPQRASTPKAFAGVARYKAPVSSVRTGGGLAVW